MNTKANGQHPRSRPVVLSTRTTHTERAIVQAVADAENLSVCEAVHRILMPAVRRRWVEIEEAAARRPS